MSTVRQSEDFAESSPFVASMLLDNDAVFGAAKRPPDCVGLPQGGTCDYFPQRSDDVARRHQTRTNGDGFLPITDTLDFFTLASSKINHEESLFCITSL